MKRSGTGEVKRSGMVIAAAVVAGVAVLSLACGDATAPDGSVRGTYQLTAVNGSSLPEIFLQGEASGVPVTITMISGELTLRGATYDETWVVNTILDGTDLGNSTLEGNGSYEVEGQLITFDPELGPSFTGVIENGTITATETYPDFENVDVTLTWSK